MTSILGISAFYHDSAATLVRDGELARIEYAEQEKKIFLTKLIIPSSINSLEFEKLFIKSVLEHLSQKNYKVVPTSPKIAGFVRKNKTYKSLLPVGIKL